MESDNNEESVNQSGSLEITSYDSFYKKSHADIDDIKNFLKNWVTGISGIPHTENFTEKFSDGIIPNFTQEISASILNEKEYHQQQIEIAHKSLNSIKALNFLYVLDRLRKNNFFCESSYKIKDLIGLSGDSNKTTYNEVRNFLLNKGLIRIATDLEILKIKNFSSRGSRVYYALTDKAISALDSNMNFRNLVYWCAESDGIGKFVDDRIEFLKLSEAQREKELAVKEQKQFKREQQEKLKDPIQKILHFFDQQGWNNKVLHHSTIEEELVMRGIVSRNKWRGRYDQYGNVLQPGYRQYLIRLKCLIPQEEGLYLKVKLNPDVKFGISSRI